MLGIKIPLLDQKQLDFFLFYPCVVRIDHRFFFISILFTFFDIINNTTIAGKTVYFVIKCSSDGCYISPPGMSSEIHLKFNYPPFSITITICIVKSNYVNGALHFIIEVKFSIQFLIMVVIFYICHNIR